jgi:CO/xanthine dehydrogenase FAD-binding subunit
MMSLDSEFHDARSLEQVSDLLTRFGPDARLFAGGTDLLIDAKRGRIHPTHVISINNIPSLRGVTPTTDGIRIGALTTVNELSASSTVRTHFPSMLDATQKMAGPQIRNMATVGGNICNANHCADLPPILMVMNAKVSLWSRSDRRELPLEAFFTGPKQTARRHDEVLTEIFVPYPPAKFGAAYARFSLRESNAIAVAGVAAGLTLDGSIIRQARIAFSAAAPSPALVREAATVLVGQVLDEAALNRATAVAVKASHPISDIRGQADFRLALVDSLTRTALVLAHQRAQTAGSSVN